MCSWRFYAAPVAEPVGVVLAGGRGRRLGGAKANVRVAGQPLLHWPLSALAALPARAVVAKSSSELPALPADVELWVEPSSPQHPLVGLRHALRVAAGQEVVVCAVDLPLVSAVTVQRLARALDGGDELAAVACSGGRVQPLLGLYRTEALERLAPEFGDAPVTDVVLSRLRPLVLEVAREELLNVNRPEDVQVAEAFLASRA